MGPNKSVNTSQDLPEIRSGDGEIEFEVPLPSSAYAQVQKGAEKESFLKTDMSSLFADEVQNEVIFEP